MMLPAVNMATFIVELPLSWKNSEVKNKSKIMSVIVDWMFTKRNEAIRHKVIISNDRTIANRLITFTCLPSPLHPKLLFLREG